MRTVGCPFLRILLFTPPRSVLLSFYRVGENGGISIKCIKLIPKREGCTQRKYQIVEQMRVVRHTLSRSYDSPFLQWRYVNFVNAVTERA